MTRGRSLCICVLLVATAGMAAAAGAEKKKAGAATAAEGALSVLWRRGAPGRIDHVWIAPERVVTAAGGHLQGIERSGGRLVWEAKRRAKILSGVVIASRLLFVDETGRMAAYQAGDGKVMWADSAGRKKKKPGGPASFLPLAGGAEIIAVEPWRVSRRAVEDGKVAWSRDLPEVNRSGAVIQDGSLILPAGRSLVAYRLESMEALWGEDRGGVSYLARVTEGGEAVIVVTERDLLIRLDAATGRRLWQAEQSVSLGRALPPPGGNDLDALVYLESLSRARTEAAGGAPGIAQLQLDGERAYVAGSDFTARAYNLATGAQRWSLPLRGSASLHRAGTLLCVQGASPGLQCVDPESGKKVWEYPDDVELLVPLADGLLALGSGHDIRLLDSRDGRPLGRARLGHRVISLHAASGADLLLARTRGGLVALGIGRS